MTLLNNLYTLTDVDAETLTFHIRLNPDCYIYQAHFPGEPITPGVCIIQIASELLTRHLGIDLHLQTVINAKFLHIVNPLEITDIFYRFTNLKRDGEFLKASAIVSDNNFVYSKLSLLFIEK